MLQFILALFIIIVIIILMLWLNKSHNPNNMNTNVFSLVGKDGIVIKDINPLEATGQVKVGGELWSATCNENNISKDTTITVVDVDGVKLKVKPK